LKPGAGGLHAGPMFSGIVEEAGKIVSVEKTPRSIRMVVQAAVVGRGVKIGDSIAVNGCCLTVVKLVRARQGTRLHFDLLEETWRKTSFAGLAEGGVVNLERSLRMNDRLGGHFVTGHVDGTGEILRWERSGQDWVLEVRPPAELMRYFLYKGSVAIDGISLTVAEVQGDFVRCWIIPHTWEVTNLREKKAGDRVNLEADLLGKYVERLIAAREPSSATPAPPSSKARRSARAKC
jgi:riboflavin synthase